MGQASRRVNANIKTPGMANIFWMPIQTRTEMLTTGFRSVLGVKVFGPDLGGIQKLGVQIEKALADLPNTRSAFAERTIGGYFLDFTVNREAAARYGLKVGDVNDIIESAIGGKNITTTVEGRERYPMNSRYARDFREDLDALKRVLVPTPTGAQVPISMLADIQYQNRSAFSPKREWQARRICLCRYYDERHRRLCTRKASQLLGQRIHYPPGYYIEWAGQFQYLQAAKERLKVVIPFTLLIIFVLLYFSTRSIIRTFIILLTVPFSLVRSVLVALASWLQHERRRLGRPHRPRRCERRDRCRHAALSRSRLGQVQRRRAHEHDERFARRRDGGRGATNPAKDHDGVRDPVRSFANHVVPYPASWR